MVRESPAGNNPYSLIKRVYCNIVGLEEWIQLIGSLLLDLKILHVPEAEDKNGTFVVPGVPTIEI